MWTEALSKDGKVSSKRVIMFAMSVTGIIMVLLQAFIFVFTYISTLGVEDAIFNCPAVFPDIVWYSVFGLIGALAGVNGYEHGKGKKVKSTQTTTEELP